MKQHELIAVEGDIKKQSRDKQTEIYKTVQKSDLFSGMEKRYTPLDEDGVKYPDEDRRLQFRLDALAQDFESYTRRLWDILHKKDLTNQEAKADIVIEGQVLAEKVPVTTLLTLESELSNVKTFIRHLPTLPRDTSWTFEEASSVYKSREVVTYKTTKESKPVVLYPATEKHPAQVQLVTQDVIQGTWSTIKTSTAIPERVKERLLERVSVLIRAVKKARERANSREVEQPGYSIGENLLRFVFSDEFK